MGTGGDAGHGVEVVRRCQTVHGLAGVPVHAGAAGVKAPHRLGWAPKEHANHRQTNPHTPGLRPLHCLLIKQAISNEQHCVEQVDGGRLGDGADTGFATLCSSVPAPSILLAKQARTIKRQRTGRMLGPPLPFARAASPAKSQSTPFPSRVSYAPVHCNSRTGEAGKAVTDRRASTARTIEELISEASEDEASSGRNIRGGKGRTKATGGSRCSQAQGTGACLPMVWASRTQHPPCLLRESCCSADPWVRDASVHVA